MNSNTKSVAIVGVACRFPGAKNYTEFWNNISSGVDNVQKIENSRWERNKQYVKYKDLYGNDKFKWAALLDQIDEFDNEFFGISPKEASVMDPQQRLLLEESWHCIEDSGISLKELQTATTSVHIGVSAVDYQYHLCNLDRETTGYDTLGLYPCVLSNRLSYYLNLTGSSQSLDTACASSLVALHDAKETILQGKAKYSLVGGVVLMGYPWRYLSFIKANMLSPDGKCKTFDASADGFVPGEGVGVVLLESVEDALANNHHIYGVIKGSSVHHSGRSKVLTAPSISAQKRVITEALSENAVSPLTISYVEAHGTGTSLGDPIEVEALTQAFGTPERQYCKIGSVKTNIGHLGAAAGMAGLIKVLLMMKNKVIPPSLNVSVVNPLIDFDNSPFKLANTLTPWELSDENDVRRAGVSSFGFGGVNSHVVLEEYKEPKKQALTENATGYPFVLSSKTQESLKSQIIAWKKYTDSSEFKSQELKDISYTLTTGRSNFEERIGLFVKDKDDLKAQILAFDPEEIHDKPHKDQKLLFCLSPIQNAESDQANFKVLHTTIDKLIRSGFKPSCITGFGLAGIVGLVISGLLEYDEACKWIADQTTSIKLKRPHTPFYDIRSEKMFLPYTPSEKYLTELTDSLELESTTQDQLCSHSKKLLSNQRTFTKLVEEWENLLKKFDLSIKDSLDSLRTLDKKQQLVISVALLFCIKKLNLKWDLSDKIHVDNDRMSEILDLLLDEVLLPDELIKFLLQPSALLKMTLVKDMETRIEKVRPTNPYKLLKSFSCDDVEYTDPHTWLSSIYTYTCDPETVKMPFAENQWRISVNDEWLKTFDKNLPSLLIAA